MGAKIVDGWTFVTDPFSDHHEISLKEYHKEFDIHPALLLSDAKSAVDYVEIFFKKVIPYLHQWTNERANKYFEDISYKSIKLYGLKHRPIQTNDMYVFISHGHCTTATNGRLLFVKRIL